MADQYPDLEWRGDVPVSTRFDDPYFSFGDGLAETRHVFLSGNGLPERFAPGFSIAELGFGTGLNAFAALSEWRAAGIGGVLHFTSFELAPMAAGDMARAVAAYPELQDIAAPVIAARADGALTLEVSDFRLAIIAGDVRRTLPDWGGRADAWFLDGFAPARNPEMWEPALMAQVAGHTAPGGTAATYTAAGDVRRALGAAGFTVARQTGFGRKRHMTVARLG